MLRHATCAGRGKASNRLRASALVLRIVEPTTVTVPYPFRVAGSNDPRQLNGNALEREEHVVSPCASLLVGTNAH